MAPYALKRGFAPVPALYATGATRQRLTIAIYGGSFNPWHAGHQHLVDTIAKRCRIHQLWLLVTGQNPLKESSDDTLPDRLNALRQRRWRYGTRILSLDTAFATPYTALLMRVLRARAPRARLLWLMGSDGLYSLPRWFAWRDFVKKNNLVIFARPRYTYFNKTLFYYYMKQYGLNERKASILHRYPSPAWLILRSRLCSQSSTQTRTNAKR